MIKSLIVENVIGMPDGTMTFGNVNRLTGKNGSGKTSVGRAILAALTGLKPDLSGVSDSFACDNTKLSQIEVVIGNDIIRRKRTPSGAVSLSINHAPLTLSGLEKFLGMPAEAAAVMFWPESFFALDAQKRRSIFLAITPDANVRGIFREMTKGHELDDEKMWEWEPKKLRDHYGKIRLGFEKEIAAIEGYLSATRTEMKAREEEMLAFVRGRQTIAELRNAAECDASAVVALKKVKARWEKNAEAVAAIAAHKKALAEVRAENDRRSELGKQVKDLAPLRKAVEEAVEKAALHREKMAGMEAEGKHLKSQAAGLNANTSVCPQCGYTAANVEKVAAINKKLQAVRAEWEGLRLTGEVVANIVKNAKDALAEAEQVNLNLGDLREISLPKLDIVEVENVAFDQSLLDVAIERAAASTAKLRESETVERQMTANHDAKLALEKRIAEKAAQQKTFKEQWERAKTIEVALNPKSGCFALALRRKLEKVALPGFCFEFEATRANGDVVDAFIIARESDGLAVESLSSGQRIKFCLALSALIADLSKTAIRACFIEHADLLDGVTRPPGFQVFAERVSKEDFKLEVLG